MIRAQAGSSFSSGFDRPLGIGSSPSFEPPADALWQGGLDFAGSTLTRPSSPAPAENGCVLLIGTDIVLQVTQDAVLRSAGYATICLRRFADMDLAALAGVDLVILCRTLAPAQALEIGCALHAHVPGTPILRFAHWETTGFEVGHSSSGFVTPTFLLAEVKRLIRSRPSANGNSY